MRTLVSLLGLLAAIIVQPSAFAGIMTFDALEQSGTSLVQTSDPYTEGNMRITGGSLYFYEQGSSAYAGSAGLHARISNGLITLDLVNGDAFSLTSIDLSVLDPSGVSPPVSFTGFLDGGGTVSQTLQPVSFGFSTFFFAPTFNNLTSVEWRQGANQTNAHQFDNISIDANPVPEPSSLVIFGLVAIGIIGFRRRKSEYDGGCTVAETC